MKLWIKTLNGDKLTNSVVIPAPTPITADTVTAALRDVLIDHDVPTPNVLASHARNLAAFNITRFTPYDFVESVPFKQMILELLKDDKEKSPHKRHYLDEV